MHLNRYTKMMILLTLTFSFALADVQPKVLLVYNSTNTYSQIDMTGFISSLNDAGIKYDLLNKKSQTISLSDINQYPVVVISELTLITSEITDINTYVNQGGGIIVTGKSAHGLEGLLGIASFNTKSTTTSTEVRFSIDHPLSYGCFWDGASMVDPPMPSDEIPTISQFVYPETSWPAYFAVAGMGTVIANWYKDSNIWNAGKQEAAIIAHAYGKGRTVYCGVLPGVFNDPKWKWPLVWRRFIINAVEWGGKADYLVELGYWPSAYKASFVWSGDTETPAMETAVPSILNIFDSLGLQQFGTFYVVGKKGGDTGTEGALEHPDIVKMIVEKGSEVGGHGNVHTGFDKGSLAEQTERLQEMVDINNAFIQQYGESCRGFRAPHLDFTSDTRQACADVGLLYESSDIDVWSETLFPFWDKVWETPPTMPMDWTLFENTPVSNEAAIEIYKDKFDYIYANRAMFNWLCHPWVIDGHIDVLKNVLEYAIDKRDVWMTRQDRLIEWWAKRVKLRTTDVVRNRDTIYVSVKNTGSEPIENATVWLKLRKGIVAKDFIANISGSKLATFERVHNGQNYMATLIPEIGAGETKTVQIKAVTGTGLLPIKKRASIKNFILYPNYPNPFNPMTTIRFYMARAGIISGNLYNIDGKNVKVLVSGTFAAGEHHISFSGKGLSSGLYFVRFYSNGQSESKKIALLK